ncbi:MAG: 16S rRNA (cytidine(1402)-2'-O)-methyltransferase [Patescibacteria group bacterium]
MLYIVATPLGNLDDISIRQAKTLVNSEIILAEDTRSAFKLLEAIKTKFNYKVIDNQKIISFYKEKEYQESFEIIKDLEAGKTISLISESGTPLISDPGEILLKEVIKRKIQFTIVPGSTALITALLHSGFPAQSFMFLGFAPKEDKTLKKLIVKIQRISEIEPNTSFIFYLSKYRYNNTLNVFNDMVPDAEICICREMTKKFEEIIRGKPKNLMNLKLKGELTVVLTFVTSKSVKTR